VCYSPTVTASGASVFALMDNSATSYIKSFRSTDSGATFAAAQAIESTISNSGYPLIAIDPSGVNVFVTFGVIGSGLHNYYMASTDGGVTFSTPAIIATWPSPVPFSGPTFVALTGNTVHLVWSMLNGTGNHHAIYYTQNPTGNPTVPTATSTNAATTTASAAAGSSTTVATTAAAVPSVAASAMLRLLPLAVVLIAHCHQ
jgi:hypothetical protein